MPPRRRRDYAVLPSGRISRRKGFRPLSRYKLHYLKIERWKVEFFKERRRKYTPLTEPWRQWDEWN